VVADGIGLVTYNFGTRNFGTHIIVTGPDDEFRGTYQGSSALTNALAIVEYNHGPPSVSRIDMCAVPQAGCSGVPVR
jgi:hypothetical protein